MDLGAPYRAVVPSLDGPVLWALERTTRPLSGREVHRLTGSGSAAGVRKVLARLVDHGLVNVTEAGTALLYTANRHHLAWPAVVALMNVRTRLIERLTLTVADWEVRPVLVGLFGSAARGGGHTDSDLDLLVVRPDDIADWLDDPDAPVARQWGGQVAELRDMARSSTGNHAQVLELSASSFSEIIASGEPIVAEWRRDLVTVGGQAPWNRRSGAGAWNEPAR